MITPTFSSAILTDIYMVSISVVRPADQKLKWSSRGFKCCNYNREKKNILLEENSS